MLGKYARELNAKLEAINRSQAVAEFNMDGTVITGNENFLAVFGYTLAEIQGHHHSMFVESKERDSTAYRAFWASLNKGEYQAGEYRRLGKNGKEVWIQASYNHPRPMRKAIQGSEACDRHYLAQGANGRL
jgi:methyl-accepting chemotaxis protein